MAVAKRRVGAQPHAMPVVTPRPVPATQTPQHAAVGTRAAAPRTQSTAQTPYKEEVGTRTTDVQAKRGKDVYYDDSKREEVLRRRFGPNEHPAFVRFSAGLTIKTGDFESLRIDSSVTLPCLPEEIDVTHILASEFVATRISEEEVLWLGPKR